MKIKLWLISLMSVTAFATTGSQAPISSAGENHTKEAKTAHKSLSVTSEQAKTLDSIINELTNTTNTEVSSPEELFKVINGETQTNSRELPLQGTTTRAVSQGYQITCYQEGNETVVASTDPTLLGQPVSNFKTSDGKSVRDRAIEEIRTHGRDDKATFTYTQENGPIVDGHKIEQGRIVAAAGRKAFKGFNSEKKFLCTVAADIAK